MARVAEGVKYNESNLDFVLALGDNFYDFGLSLDGADRETRFKATYEDVYKHPSLQVPWYAIAGNHDHCGSVAQQLELSVGHSRWTYPDLNHIVTRQITTSKGDVKKLEIIMIDTQELAGQMCDPEVEMGILSTDIEAIKKQKATLQWIKE